MQVKKLMNDPEFRAEVSWGGERERKREEPCGAGLFGRL